MAAARAWPPVALIACVEVLAGMLRAREPKQMFTEHDVPAESNGHDPGVTAVLDAVPPGTVPPIREIRRILSCGILSCGQPRATQVQAGIRALVG